MIFIPLLISVSKAEEEDIEKQNGGAVETKKQNGGAEETKRSEEDKERRKKGGMKEKE